MNDGPQAPAARPPEGGSGRLGAARRWPEASPKVPSAALT